ncbi:hypothetical protein BDZ85DRAFT_301414 [Elsinoe ampelina]|uniref:Uncharacterized protein n=1 Tax=Elsinoe ampelina TaxID=302913 RepID=A0A6A6G697_9PEZI|nr:hypothetical protein BDZ85DRAFT_301414 [Elsinoe ampelina]
MSERMRVDSLRVRSEGEESSHKRSRSGSFDPESETQECDDEPSVSRPKIKSSFRNDDTGNSSTPKVGRHAPHEYQVGWICALPVELAAAKTMLDEVHEPLEDQEVNDHNTYALGRIGSHNIVIACLSAGRYGTVSAATVAKDMVRTFSTSLRIGLMVGIGGGIPSPTNDIRLGDIVVSQPTGTYGGLVQYDFGKVTAGGHLERTGSLNSPPQPLLTALAHLEAAHLTDDPKFVRYMQQSITRNARTTKTFKMPPRNTDRLFKPQYPHPKDADACTDCLDSWTTTRETRESLEPNVFYGTIASANVLMKDAPSRDLIGKQLGALCCEMEAAGLMQEFPCLVIRGICDYADSHKNKDWQGYAALAAAAYAKELLGFIPVKLSNQRLVSDICALNITLKETQKQRWQMHEEDISRAWDDEAVKCHQAFKTSDYNQFKDINPFREEGTCQWALRHSSFRSWVNDEESGVLWISADPGCGKSVLSRSLVDHDLGASFDSHITVCHYFFKDSPQQNMLGPAFTAVIHQVLSQQPELIEHCMPAWRKNGSSLMAESKSLWNLLVRSCAENAKEPVVCVLDALDECSSRERELLIRRLSSFQKGDFGDLRTKKLKFLVTSRPYADINNEFRRLVDAFPNIHLNGDYESDSICQEIDIVLRSRVEQLARDVDLTDSERAIILERLQSVQNRTYLWLHLTLNSLREQLLRRLQPGRVDFVMVPSSVQEAYERMLSKVEKQHVDIVRQIFAIMLGAERAISVVEMGALIGLSLSDEAERSTSCFISEDWLGKNIRSWCGLFVFINNGFLYLVHQTAKEFLLTMGQPRNLGWKACISEAYANQILTRVLVRLLLCEDPQDLLPTELEDHHFHMAKFLRDNTDYPLLRLFLYASWMWIKHCRAAQTQPVNQLMLEAKSLYDTDRIANRLWSREFIINCVRHSEAANVSRSRFPDRCPVLHLVAVSGQHQLMGNFPGPCVDVGLDGQTPLLFACVVGYAKMVALLLDHGADCTLAEYDGYGLIEIAIEHGNEQVAVLCLRRGLGVSTAPYTEARYGSLLGYAAFCACHTVTDAMVESGIDILQPGLRVQPLVGPIARPYGFGSWQETLKLLLEADKLYVRNVFNCRDYWHEKHEVLVEYLTYLLCYYNSERLHKLAHFFFDTFLGYTTESRDAWFAESLFLLAKRQNLDLGSDYSARDLGVLIEHLLHRDEAKGLTSWSYHCYLQAAEANEDKALMEIFSSLGASDLFHGFDASRLTPEERFQSFQCPHSPGKVTAFPRLLSEAHCNEKRTGRRG